MALIIVERREAGIAPVIYPFFLALLHATFLLMPGRLEHLLEIEHKNSSQN